MTLNASTLRNQGKLNRNAESVIENSVIHILIDNIWNHMTLTNNFAVNIVMRDSTVLPSCINIWENIMVEQQLNSASHQKNMPVICIPT